MAKDIDRNINSQLISNSGEIPEDIIEQIKQMKDEINELSKTQEKSDKIIKALSVFDPNKYTFTTVTIEEANVINAVNEEFRNFYDNLEPDTLYYVENRVLSDTGATGMVYFALHFGALTSPSKKFHTAVSQTLFSSADLGQSTCVWGHPFYIPADSDIKKLSYSVYASVPATFKSQFTLYKLT